MKPKYKIGQKVWALVEDEEYEECKTCKQLIFDGAVSPKKIEITRIETCQTVEGEYVLYNENIDECDIFLTKEECLNRINKQEERK